MTAAWGYATVDEVMQVYGVSRSFVYKKASQEKWGRYRRPDGTVRYRRDQVAKTLEDLARRQAAKAGGKVRD